jgi:hypothetical protein
VLAHECRATFSHLSETSALPAQLQNLRSEIFRISRRDENACTGGFDELTRLSLDAEDDRRLHREALEDLGRNHRAKERRVPEQHEADIRSFPQPRHPVLGLLPEHHDVLQAQLFATTREPFALGPVTDHQEHDIPMLTKARGGIEQRIEAVRHAVCTKIGRDEAVAQPDLFAKRLRAPRIETLQVGAVLDDGDL